MAGNIASRERAKILWAKKKQNHLNKVSADWIWWSGARFLSKTDVPSKIPPVVHENSYTPHILLYFPFLEGESDSLLLICISLSTSTFEHVFTHLLAFWISSFVNCLFMFFAHLKGGFSAFYLFAGAPYKVQVFNLSLALDISDMLSPTYYWSFNFVHLSFIEQKALI